MRARVPPSEKYGPGPLHLSKGLHGDSDILKHLVSLAPVASEGVQREYHTVLDDLRDAWDKVASDTRATVKDTQDKAEGVIGE
jgi:hypothetical protein